MGESLKLVIEAQNSTGKGWDKVEKDAKSRAKKIRDALNRESNSTTSNGGFMNNIRGGYDKGSKGGIGSMLPGGGLGGMGVVAGVAAGVGALAAVIYKLGSAANEYSESMMKISENTGVGLKSAQNLVYIGKRFDVSAEEIEMSMGRIAKAQSEAFSDEGVQKSLKSLNIPIAEFVNMKPDEAFSRLGKALKETGDRADVMSIVGKGGLHQMAFMKEISGGIKDIGLASDQNIESVHSFGTAIEQLFMKFKAGTVNKIGQALRGDMGAFMGATPEASKQPSNADEMNAQNESFKEEERAKYRAGLLKDNKELEASTEAEKAEALAREQGTHDFDQQKTAMGTKQDVFGRLAGRGDLDAQGTVDREMHMAIDGKFRQAERKTDRQIDRQRTRAENLLNQANKANLEGTLKNNPRLKRVFDAEQKRVALANIEDNLKQRQLQAAEAQIRMQADTAAIKANTSEIQTLKAFLALKN